jgi:hypothetical protein
VDHVDLLVHPGAANVLVEAHGPEGDDPPLRVAVEVGQLLQLLLVDAGKLARVFECVGLELLHELLEADRPVGAGLAAHALPLLGRVVVG